MQEAFVIQALPDGKALVRPASKGCVHCSGCGGEGGCAAGEYLVWNPLNAPAGARVRISQARAGLLPRVLLDLLPPAAFGLGFWACGALGAAETLRVWVSIGAFLLGLGISVYFRRRIKHRCMNNAEILEVF